MIEGRELYHIFYWRDATCSQMYHFFYMDDEPSKIDMV